jgi:hypothetical protein
MATIPYAFLRPPGCFSSSDACELLIRYPGGRISHHRDEGGAVHETFLALPQPGGGEAVLIWKDSEGSYFRGRLATLEVAAVGSCLAEVMMSGEETADVAASDRLRRPQRAPRPTSTTATVRSRIRRSRPSDRFAI